MLDKIDLWLGKKLFVPLAIRACQQFKINQYTLHTYIWLLVWFSFVWDGPGKHPGIFGWFIYVVICVFALFWTVAAAVMPHEMVKRSAGWIRALWWLGASIAIFGIVAAAITKDSPFLYSQVYIFTRDWLVLLAEYALTIRTIPPLEAKEKKHAGKLARQRA
jgi:hypothetical protein